MCKIMILPPGLGLTVAVPVYNGNQTFGVVAVDGSMATVFSEVVNFNVGTNSYMYVVDSMHGKNLPRYNLL